MHCVSSGANVVKGTNITNCRYGRFNSESFQKIKTINQDHQSDSRSKQLSPGDGDNSRHQHHFHHFPSNFHLQNRNNILEQFPAHHRAHHRCITKCPWPVRSALRWHCDGIAVTSHPRSPRRAAQTNRPPRPRSLKTLLDVAGQFSHRINKDVPKHIRHRNIMSKQVSKHV